MLGTMPNIPQYQYGLFTLENEIVGVACFGIGHGSRSRLLCGEENMSKVICLERGACVHWAHPHAASFLISRACKLAYQEQGHQIFYAYSDAEAGEIGTVYQACNWSYLGVAPGRSSKWRYIYIKPDGTEINSRAERKLRKTCGHTLDDHLSRGWSRRRHNEKGKYVWFEGSKTEKKRFQKSLVHAVHSYPKR